MESETIPLVRQSCTACYRMFPRDADHFYTKVYVPGKVEKLTSICKECYARIVADPTKICAHCKRELPADLDHFYSYAANIRGLSSYCKECARAKSKAHYEKVRKPRPKKVREPWDPKKHDYLTDEIQYDFEQTGEIPPGFYACRGCGKVKANTFRNFPRQPGSFRNADGSRKFSTICRSCRNKQRRRARQRQKYQQEMKRARINEEWEPDTEADMRRWAQLPPEEQENW